MSAISTPKEVLNLHHATTSLATFGLAALKTVHGLLPHTYLGSRIQMQTGRAGFLMSAQNGS